MGSGGLRSGELGQGIGVPNSPQPPRPQPHPQPTNPPDFNPPNPNPPNPNLSPLCGESCTSALLQTFVRRLRSNSWSHSYVSPVVWRIFLVANLLWRIFHVANPLATLWLHTNFFFLIKSNLDYTRFIKFVVVPKRGSEWRGSIPRLSTWSTQLQRNVAEVSSDFTGLGIESQTFRIDSEIF